MVFAKCRVVAQAVSRLDELPGQSVEKTITKQGMRVLITGASGFVGTSLVRSLREAGHKVIGLHRVAPEASEGGEICIADLSCRFTRGLPEDHFDAVIHLAQSRWYREFPQRANDIFSVNVESTFRLLQWAKRVGVKKFILASTASLYDSRVPFHNESSSLVAETFYTASKLAAETLAKSYDSFFNVDILRFFTIYGPGQVGKLMPTIMSRIKAGEVITLQGGEGLEFTPIYIDDVCKAISSLLVDTSNNLARVVNVCGDEHLSLKTAAAIIGEVLGREPTFIEQEGPQVHITGCNHKLKSLVPLIEFTSFREGIVRCTSH